MTDYLKPSFTVPVGSAAFQEGHARIFDKKPEPDFCPAIPDTFTDAYRQHCYCRETLPVQCCGCGKFRP